MNSKPVIGSFSLPLSDPKFNFFNAKALADFLNDREGQHGEIIKALGYYSDRDSGQPAGNFYDYEPVEIVDDPPAQPLLQLLLVTQPWENFITDKVGRVQFIDHSLVILNGQQTEVALVRAIQNPATNEQGELITTSPGWDWLTPKIENDDLVVSGARCTWFGGPHDNEDSGGTASGLVNTRRQPDFRGCALPMDGFRNSKNTLGSPLPRFRWLTPVEVECVEPDLIGRKLNVELIDLGPAKRTKAAIDLTEPAFRALGASSSRGVIKVNYRIRNWKQQLEPGAVFTEVPASSSEQKPVDENGNKIHEKPQLPGSFDTPAFRAFIGSLKLQFFSADELIPYFASVRNGVSNAPPDPAFWPNFAPVLLVLDKLRSTLGKAIRVTSSYRSPAYNLQLDGAAALSQHMAFRAADIQAVGGLPGEVHEVLRGLRGSVLAIPAGAQFRAAVMVNSGNGLNPRTPFNVTGLQIRDPSSVADGQFLFEGGLGLYGTFVHADCRGIRADW